MPTPAHHILGVSSQAKETEIRNAYRDLAKKWHPDKYTGDKQYANEQFKRIKTAYEQMMVDLGNPQPPASNPIGSGVFTNPTTRRPGPPFVPGYSPFGRVPRYSNGMNPTGTFGQANPGPASNTFTRPNTVGCQGSSCPTGGPVLFPGNFHPSQMSFDMLQQLRQSRGT